KNFWKDVEHRMANIIPDLMKYQLNRTMAKGINKYFDRQKIIIGGGSVKCLFVFDEACILVNQKVEIAKEGSQLFKPFYLLDTVDINMEMINTNREFKYVSKLKESENPQYFFQYKRPLWGALLLPSDEVKGFKPEHIIELAIDKLIGRKSFIY
ncbi:4717_t:CDS:2, partial [Dentiscutata heterogama]